MELINRQTIAAYRLAYTFPLFEYADDSGVIRACIIGSDPFCEEYLKAAVWSTQRDGFRLELDVFAAKSECARLQKLYPEVFCTEGLSDRHEIFCDVRLKSGAPCGSYGFAMTAGECYALSVNAAKAVIISDERALRQIGYPALHVTGAERRGFSCAKRHREAGAFAFLPLRRQRRAVFSGRIQLSFFGSVRDVLGYPQAAGREH